MSQETIRAAERAAGQVKTMSTYDPDSDQLHEECGIFGVWAPDRDVARLTYFGLRALQHRGQESAGIAVGDGGTVMVRKDLGLLDRVFSNADLSTLSGQLAVGHVRYGTAGAKSWEASQPHLSTINSVIIALAHNGTLVNTDELRRRDYDAVCEKLMGVSGFNKVVVNAVCYDDVAVFVTAYLRAAARGKVFMFRGSAAVVKVLGAVSDQPLLQREDLMCADQRNGGIIIVGSHVRKTTMQLETLQKGCPEIEYICFDVNTVFDDAALAAERRRILDRTNTLLAGGTTVAVYTSRMVLRSEDDQREKNLAISVKISDALTSLVADLTVRPAFVLAKGGITSSDVGVKALRVHCARVRGQIAPGVPVWETGEESTFPHTPYIIFPGNVGTEGTLCQVVQTLLKK